MWSFFGPRSCRCDLPSAESVLDEISGEIWGDPGIREIVFLSDPVHLETRTDLHKLYKVSGRSQYSQWCGVHPVHWSRSMFLSSTVLICAHTDTEYYWIIFSKSIQYPHVTLKWTSQEQKSIIIFNHQQKPCEPPAKIRSPGPCCNTAWVLYKNSLYKNLRGSNPRRATYFQLYQTHSTLRIWGALE